MRAWSRVVEVRDSDRSFDATLDLSDWRSLLASLEGTDRLVSFQREKMDRVTYNIAREFSLTYDLIVALQVTSEGEENGSFAIRVEDLTRVDLGDRYVSAIKRIMNTNSDA